ncbi:FAD-binding oxidoreductase [Pseudonocardia humida]|uniref:FAD-binding oxidoreductase n=1 Tax=Pseudonocardia humida TaxID=2800819 RepID=A0ABT0ZZK1_9PSEU|nr:FAD-binding oxidoreductase [Pseudonocardia humida]MCO1656167.1 FAD-binding oxidoreductase [Pseudonocardia humida]
MAVSRRAVLGAAALAVAGITGCAPAVASSGAVGVPDRPPPDWEPLRARLAGALVLPGDPRYDTARLSHNTLFDGRRPAAVAACANPADVQACLEFARTAGVPVAARSGGHSYAGYSVPDGGLVIDVAALAGVAVGADGTATIGAGARLGDVYAAVGGAGRALPAGSCPSVGVAGLTLGGGIGVLTRAYGLTCDRLVSAQVVTPDSTLRTVSGRDDPDLFWALRGGGGGNAAVVTSFEFATEAAPTVTVFSLRFAAGAAADVLPAWQAWAAAAPDELWSTCALSSGSPPGARIAGSFLGGESACRDQLAGLLAGAPAPSSAVVSTKDYLAAMRWFAGGSDRETFVASSRVLPAPLPEPAKLVALLDRASGIAVLLDALGGAAGRVDPAETAFPHRTAFASAQVYASVSGDPGPATTAVAEVRDGLGALTGATGYVNYIDPAMPDWASAYYGANLARLRATVERYDPDRVLAFAQSPA